ncbi:undecaprenyldiphospho-muramoylpentapeptide beta-N-acetylglucosaminyltransferase [Chthonobacter rhizosphaerae]|uniref:undecaprenyldiphospho-muramoylpentapeptide beta-N-acetylglucosaminyltransferase n=1 Tax=Chthonobacter rhizosphaerae TaxID=2735553 RepID=UPI0015EECB96|nr:undecaprenyldiphospho-muramoylpentapeptide beta-N-acetylglucosaminyltransferase [Chthonobacter rhizosphaerae]
MANPVLITAGGTGGHLFPAESLAHELTRRGIPVHLATDHRVASYGQDFPAEAVHLIASATFGDRSPLGLAKSGLKIVRGGVQSFGLVNRIRPRAAIGFGGYPTLPPMLAAVARRVPTLIHEANAVAGRANRFLAPKVTAVATTFETTGLLGEAAAKAVVTGNPVRPRVIDAAAPYATPSPDGPFELVVFGGSQGARVFSDLVPPALAELPGHLRTRIRLVQQARPEDVTRVEVLLNGLGVTAEIAPFFTDLPARIARAHLVIGRSGASTVSELAIIGRPSVLVPLPHALDNDQKTNALELERVGGAVMAEQASLTPQTLAALLSDLMQAPDRLAGMAEKAKAMGRPDAVARLADLVEHVASGGKPADFKSGEAPKGLNTGEAPTEAKTGEAPTEAKTGEAPTGRGASPSTETGVSPADQTRT